MLCPKCKNAIPSIPITLCTTVSCHRVLTFVFLLDQDLTTTRKQKNNKGSVNDWRKQKMNITVIFTAEEN